MAQIWKSRLIWIARLAVIGLVGWGVWANFKKAILQVQEQDFQFAEIRWTWIVASGAVYLVGTAPMGMFWYRLMRAMKQRPQLGSTLRAYFIGHLGKYVPGKALVVVLRTSLVQGDNLQRSVVATAVFAETLTMVSVGAVFSAFLIAIWFSQYQLLLLLALGIALAAGLVTVPPIFRAVVLLLKVSRINPEIEENLAGLNYRVMAWGWGANLIGWSLLGSSLYATMLSIPEADPHTHSFLAAVPLLAATVSLAMVAGFVTPLPGGMGVREFVIMEMMSPVYGPAVAVVSAVLLRVSWMLAELGLAMVLYVFGRTAKETGMNASEPASEVLPSRVH